jgi:hypothetical protein
MWIERDGELIPRPIKPWGELHGTFRPKPGEKSLLEMLRTERRAEREHEAR